MNVSGVWKSTTRRISGNPGYAVNADDKGRFFITPAPLRWNLYCVCHAWTHDAILVASHAGCLSADNQRYPSLPEYDFCRGTSARSRGTTAGTLAFRLGLLLRTEQRLCRWEIAGTDKEGRFHFTDLSVGVRPNTCWTSIRSRIFARSGCRCPWMESPLRCDWSVGSVVEGRCPGARARIGPFRGRECFSCHLSSTRAGDSDNFRAEAIADGEGRFRFQYAR